MTFRIETERLVLRAWTDADRAAFWQMACDAEVMRHNPPQDREDCEAAVDLMMAMQAEHGHCFWALESREDGAPLGFCGVVPPREPTFEVEIGWRLPRHAWGQGLALEAARASLDWAWANLDCEAIVAITVPDNARSRQLMERLGMVHCPDEDFDEPPNDDGDAGERHVLYRIDRPD